MACRALKDLKCISQRQPLCLCLHVMHLKSFNVRIAVNYPLHMSHCTALILGMGMFKKYCFIIFGLIKNKYLKMCLFK